MAEARGIEVFGRGATVVETRAAPARGPALGVLALVVGLLVAAATACGVVSALGGASEVARWWALGAIGGSILAVLLGVAALATGRGVGAGLAGLLIGTLANPWVLTRLLEAAAALA